MKKVDWHFDFISPFAYLQVHALDRLSDVEIRCRPVLLAALLNHWGQRGPAEIKTKRPFTYRHVVWLARRHGVPLTLPPAHPFNPLRALRLAIVCGCELAAIKAVFRFLWGEGKSLEDNAAFEALGRSLGVEEPLDAIAAPAVKQTLKQNSLDAIERGVFGVPTLMVGDALFWGFDATDMAADYLRDPSAFEAGDMARAQSLPVGVSRI